LITHIDYRCHLVFFRFFLTHAEYEADASVLFVTPLSCSLVGKTMQVDLVLGSIAARCYGRSRVEESYYCNFGLNPAYQESLQVAGMRISGWDADREARIVELPSHPFFLGMLFVPQRIQQTPSSRLVSRARDMRRLAGR
jgi:CTP synthase (UTP-ammonia lyase)